MWIPGGIVYTAAALACFTVWMGTLEQGMERRERQSYPDQVRQSEVDVVGKRARHDAT